MGGNHQALEIPGVSVVQLLQAAVDAEETKALHERATGRVGSESFEPYLRNKYGFASIVHYRAILVQLIAWEWPSNIEG